MQTHDGDASYRFERVATDIDGTYDREAWDRGEELHVFALTPLPATDFETIVAILTQAEQPTWPVWVPGMRQPAQSIDEAVLRDVEQILRAADGRRLVVLAPSLLTPPLTVRQIDDRDWGQTRDWFSWLGFEATTIVT